VRASTARRARRGRAHAAVKARPRFDPYWVGR